MKASKKIHHAARLLEEAIEDLKKGNPRNHPYETALEIATKGIKGLAESYKDNY